ncbi:DUF2075 domain-containing protein [Pengzhenrongella sicca]|uniref:DUF2075 domain-containing protein n=1 Tax=Pengzhenrongella sicca TaxID=2819238 RepID=A0A8A4ZKB4_9MICO|nr:DUF2075 domain-containing protein [Pengzhenrongella sicca]QTE30028.1 DUF2075 domain-containing protein [Pengzhenrongella sicca]
MTRFRVERVGFSRDAVDAWAAADPWRTNWPVVYVIDDGRHGNDRECLTKVYVGESLNARGRMRQHLDSGAKAGLSTVRVVLDETFNKSVCLDLESYLIKLFAGDGTYSVLNVNGGITDADYYHRDLYRESFDALFEELRRDGLFSRSITEIENSDLFKLSPFKALTPDQAIAIEDILEGLFVDVEFGTGSATVIQGSPGTGKTVVGIYLMKLLVDIRTASADDVHDSDWLFSDFYTDGNRVLLSHFRIGLVVPQQSLRASIKKVFHQTPGLSESMVLSPFEVGSDPLPFDLLIVDETHRLNQRANQSSGPQNTRFREINEQLFGDDDSSWTQLDWITSRSTHQICLVDSGQSVRPADLPIEQLENLTATARARRRYYPLTTQMRVRAGEDYVDYVQQILHPDALVPEPAARLFADYELLLFDDLEGMRQRIVGLDDSHGLARLVAGYAWVWKSKKDPGVFDIELDGCRLRWNSTDTDWINSPGSISEVGSIHTVQGYDLNFAGVIIGPELRYDPVGRRLFIDRTLYRDRKGKENNRVLGKKYTDDDLLRYVVNIYSVLLTRGMLGTFVYACDPDLNAYLRRYIKTVDMKPANRSSPA